MHVASSPPKNAPTLKFIADFNVDPSSSSSEDSVDRFGGISAIAYDAAAGRWLALSDERTSSRFYSLSVDYDGVSLRIRTAEAIRLRDRDGGNFPENALDPEGIAETSRGTFFISTEPDTRREPVEQAKLLEFDPGGELIRAIDLPEKFLVEGWPPHKGLRHNRGFEALTITPDGSRLFAGAEEALLQDGGEVSFNEPTFCRIVEYRLSGESIRASAEFAYPLGPVPRPETLTDPEPGSGLVELVALSETSVLALERDYVHERGEEGRGVNQTRIFIVDIAEASDVTGVASLEDTAGWTPVRKQLLLDFDDIVSKLSPGFRKLDNFEAMGLGPTLPDGGRSLLVVSDDNFSDTQRSAFLLFSLKVVDE